MAENIALIAGATWLLTAVVVGVCKRWTVLNSADKQAVALGIAGILTFSAYLTGYVSGDPVEILLTVVVALFGANLVHDKLAEPAAAAWRGDEW